MHRLRLVTLTALLALGACTTPPETGPIVRKTDTTPAPRDVWGDRAPPEIVEERPADPPPPYTPAPAGGSVRERVESYPVQR